VKSIFSPSHNRHVKLGRRRPVAPSPRMPLSRYLRAALPTPPASCDFTAKARSVLAMVYLNDQLGDCVIAGGYHIVGVETGNATGTPYVATDAVLKADYHAIGGYVDGDPSTDNGCDEDTAINYWTSHGFANGTKLLGSVSVDATNRQQVELAVWLSEELIVCMELPDAFVNPFPAGDGFVWDVAGAPVPDNGHSVAIAGYNAQGVIVITWGMIGIITWAALAKYAKPSAGGSCNMVLSPDQVAKGQTKAPNGIAWHDIVVDCDDLGMHVPVPPSPAPPAPTPPSPAPTPTALGYDACVAAVQAGLKGSGLRLMYEGTAEHYAIAGLKKAFGHV